MQRNLFVIMFLLVPGFMFPNAIFASEEHE